MTMDENTNNIPIREPLRIFIAAESADECERIAEKLSDAPDMKVVGTVSEADRLEEALCCATNVDVLISDVMIREVDMTPVLTQIKRQNEGIDILVFTNNSQDSCVIRAILAGATGYILSDSQEDLKTSVRLLRGGGSPVSPTVARSVLRAIHSRSFAPQLLVPKKRDTSDPMPLSQRETEILGLLAKGISFADIGQVLQISPHTVTAHIKKIYRKLQVHSRGEAVYEASIMGILPDRILGG